MINLNIHFLAGVTYYKSAFFVIFMLLFMFFPSLFNSSEYTLTDIICFNAAGVFQFGALTLQAVSYHFCETSKITAMNYFSGLFAFAIDLFVFKYAFTATDVAGMFLTIIFL